MGEAGARPGSKGPDETRKGTASVPAVVLGRLSTRFWLVVLIALYIGMTAAVAQLRSWEFHTGAWDLGLYQQALWSWGHGRPLYESADFVQAGYGSLLQVHTAFVLVLVAPLYDAFPSAPTLFLVQSTVVGLAAVPLFLLARDVLGSEARALLPAGLFLVWTPVVASSLFDFHVEAFLPIELFTLFWLWRRERYLPGLGVAVLAFLTLEVTPVLVAAMALFFLVPSTRGTSLALEKLRRFLRGQDPFSSTFRALGEMVARWWRAPGVRASTALLVGAVVAYYLLRAFQTFWAVPTLGLSPVPTSSVAPGGVIGATPSVLGLSLANLGLDLQSKVEYWLLVYALVGFLPLLRPRAALLVAPWVAFTFLGSSLATYQLGYQYGFVAAAPMMIGLVLGLKVLAEGRGLVSVRAPAHLPSRALGSRGVSRLFLLALCGLVLANLALSPLDPAVQAAGFGDAYHVSYDVPPGYGAVVQLASLIPAGASVIATDDLFPLVANDLAAYPFNPDLSGYDGYLPFNVSHLPSYVLVSAQHGWEVPAWIGGVLYNRTTYGVRAAVGDSPAGGVLLFELGYLGPPSLYRELAGAGVSWGAGALSLSGMSALRSTPGAPGGEAVWGVPGSQGLLWYGPQFSLASGSYRVTATVEVSTLGPGPTPSASAPVLELQVTGFDGQPAATATILFGATQPEAWDQVDLNLTLTAPVIAVEVLAYQMDPGATVETSGLQVAPS